MLINFFYRKTLFRFKSIDLIYRFKKIRIDGSLKLQYSLNALSFSNLTKIVVGRVPYFFYENCQNSRLEIVILKKKKVTAEKSKEEKLGIVCECLSAFFFQAKSYFYTETFLLEYLHLKFLASNHFPHVTSFLFKQCEISDESNLVQAKCIWRKDLCGDGYYINAVGKCDLCDSSCETCTAPGPMSCEKCSKGYGKGSIGYCRPCCPEGSTKSWQCGKEDTLKIFQVFSQLFFQRTAPSRILHF